MDKHCRILFAALCIALIIPSILTIAAEVDPPAIAGKVTPPRTYGGADFLFTATYKSPENRSAAFVRVVVEGKTYEMQEVNSEENNYTKGKDYFFRMSIPDGPAKFYFTASDGNRTVNTGVMTLYADPVGMFTGGHRDIIMFTALISPFFIAAILLLVLQVRSLKKAVEKAANRQDQGAKEETEKDNTKPADQKTNQNL